MLGHALNIIAVWKFKQWSTFRLVYTYLSYGFTLLGLHKFLIQEGFQTLKKHNEVYMKIKTCTSSFKQLRLLRISV